jgi:hypothetical protein
MRRRWQPARLVRARLHFPYTHGHPGAWRQRAQEVLEAARSRDRGHHARLQVAQEVALNLLRRPERPPPRGTDEHGPRILRYHDEILHGRPRRPPEASRKGSRRAAFRASDGSFEALLPSRSKELAE